MEFCEICGRPLIIIDNIAKCTCGFFKKANKISSNEKMQKKSEKGEGIAEEEGLDTGFPHKCGKCGHEFAEVVDLGIFYSDEASIHLFTCKKCKNTERDAYGSSNA